MNSVSLDLALILALVLALAMLGTSRIGTAIRYFSLQSAAVSLVPLFVHRDGAISADAVLLLAATIALKVIGVPYLLNRSLREAAVLTEVAPLVGYGASLGLGGALVGLSFGLARGLPLPQRPASDLLLPVAFGLFLIGLLLLVSRTKAVTQVLGYLVLENGIFLFGLLLLEAMPSLVEVGVLLDLFVAVFVMGIVIFQINRELDQTNSHQPDKLKE